ncbi:putativeinactive leucine-rich repeat receptor-like protein kinase [Quercus suber]|uniref:non-specific serine/threonine protein kinase n=1 Tax=Quercus suber TaxID=58331 RepID=A0AAW0KGX1_QUESU
MPESDVNKSGLCGGPSDSCKNHKWAFEVSFKNGFLVGFVVFVILYTVFFTHYFNLWVGSKKRSKKMRTSATVLTASRKKKGKEVDQIFKLERMVTRMSLTELHEATGNFNTSNIIRLGKFGMMHKEVLPNGLPHAIKRLHDSQSFERQFVSELLALGILKHNNIVPLSGYYRERKEKLLVNLYYWLHAAKCRTKILEWPSRIKIAIGIARGLAWLHHDCNFRVVHINLSSNSILLDHNFEPKISNFGDSIISNFGGEMFKNLRGNGIFIGSDVWELGYVKKDVYDFGILLLELVLGKESIEINNFANNSNGSLVDWIAHLLLALLISTI